MYFHSNMKRPVYLRHSALIRWNKNWRERFRRVLRENLHPFVKRFLQKMCGFNCKIWFYESKEGGYKKKFSQSSNFHRNRTPWIAGHTTLVLFQDFAATLHPPIPFFWGGKRGCCQFPAPWFIWKQQYCMTKNFGNVILPIVGSSTFYYPLFLWKKSISR